MDNLTHTLVGLVLSRAGLNRWCPAATPILLIAANAPDADIVMALGGGLTYFEHHRTLTHSLIGMPIAALATLLLVRAFTRRPFLWTRAALVALIGVFSHLVLDWTNIYGIRMLLPFSREWLRLDLVNIIDPWIWAILALAFIWPLLSRLVNSEIGARTEAGRGIAIFALVALGGYEGARAMMHAKAVAMLDARIYEGVQADRVAAFPTAANPFVWTGLVETGGFYVLHRMNLLATFDPAAGRILYKPEAVPAMEAAKRTRPFAVLLDFAQYPYWRTTPSDRSPGATVVELRDLRFGAPPSPGFSARAVVGADLRVYESSFSFGRFEKRAGR